MEGGVGPIGGPVPLPGTGVEPPKTVMSAANKVDGLNPVPKGGIPDGHPRSYAVQEAHQVSVGGTAQAVSEENVALPIIQQLGRS